LYTSSSYNLGEAAYVIAENLADSRETSLIDMTPESESSESADRRDAGLPVGGTYYNSDSGVRFNALERGGTSPNQWIKVQVVFDPRISVAETNLNVDEQSGTAHVVVQRKFSSSGTVSVNYATSDGTATSGDDYYPTSGTLIWSDGDMADKTIIIPIRPDVIAEGSEDLTLTLSGIVGGKLDPGASEATVSLLDAGQRIASFAPGFFNTTVYAIAPLSNGKVIIGGNIGAGIGPVSTIRHLARLDIDGSVDSSFLTGTGFNNIVRAIVVQDDGKILVGGDFTTYNGTGCNHLVRLNSNGTIDSSFVTAMGSAANNTVRSIAIETDGKILVGGDFTEFNGFSDRGLTRLTSAGARDSVNTLNLPFNTSFGTDIYSVLTEPDGKILVGGSFYVAYTGTGFRSGLARLNSDGSRDSSFEPDAGAHLSGSTNSLRTVYDVTKQSDGKYIIVGDFSAYDGNDSSRCARVNNDGTFDVAYTVPAFDNVAQTCVIQASGKAIIGGWYTSPVNRIERLNLTGSSDSSFDKGTGPS
ncbi:MAG: hypothetical protein KJO79_04055, partial [Verrucomicrobiae bacterium]|nr:hypothetical protein [Verrucomicrobiae bacterium]NNJ86332.1 hypothetical protein [Akkermansiaceae bacterium]